MKNNKTVKKKEPISDFERKSNIAMIIVTIIIFCGIGAGVYLSVQKPADNSNKDLSKSNQAEQNNTNTTAKAGESANAQQNSQNQKAGEKTASQETTKNENIDMSKQKTVMVNIKTAKGDIKVALYPELMPITVDNFVQLVKKSFYNGLTFHRVEDWVIQGGDPNGNGSGGSGATIKLETNPNLKNVRGAIAMARSDKMDSASSQFYILKTDASWLDNYYAVFGKVVSGMEVVDKIAVGDKMTEVKEIK
ncbi:MAG: peptidylprolyl isomerase [Ignavibacteriales bacterium]